MIRILVIDDCKKDAIRLSDFVSEYLDHAKIVYEIDILNYLDGLDIKGYDYDIVFCDIVIGDVNGIEFLKRFKKVKGDVIVCLMSRYKRFAIDGYSVGSLAYLLKPINKQKVIYLMNNIINEYLYLEKYIDDNRISPFKIHLKHIVYIEFLNKHSHVVLDNAETVITRVSINEWEKILTSKYFCRCHRSYIINYSLIKNLNNKELVMKNGVTIPISRNYKTSFLLGYYSYVQNMR